MSTSLPSREIFAVDVPRPVPFSAAFKYNYFVRDEMVAETSADAAKFNRRPADAFDAEFQQFISSRVPRYVKLDFAPARQPVARRGEQSAAARSQANSVRSGSPTLIRDNLKKLLTEDQFAAFGFIAVEFHDSEIDAKVHEFVSGSYLQRSLDAPQAQGSHYRAAQRLDEESPADVRPHDLAKGMGAPDLAHGTRFYDERGREIEDPYFRELKDVTAHVQINSKLLHDVIDRNVRDPHSPYAEDLAALHRSSKSVQRAIQQQFSPTAGPEDYKNTVPHVSTLPAAGFHPQDTNAEIVGYVIDKVEVLPDGATRVHDPIVVENGRSTTTADLHVRYGATYAYSARSVALFTLPAVDDESGDLLVVQLLVSSKPSNTVTVSCVDDDAPPPPADLNFTWDYQRERLLVHWTFPPNPQRDIKKFQVFRRKSVAQPFELVKAYDFDDSVSPTRDRETPDSSLVEKLVSPASFWVDAEFGKKSKYVYAVASVDAHGLTSNYSAQFELSFDSFKNRLVKALVSHAGAPKPYPNLYLQAEPFVNTVRDSGHSAVTLYFNPEHYSVYDDAGRVTPSVATKQAGGKYRLQFINLDAQKECSVDVFIDDLTTK